MNERIKELAEQSGINSVVPVKGALEYVGKGEIEALEKFAELIIKECAAVAAQYDFISSQQIKQHFGIK